MHKEYRGWLAQPWPRLDEPTVALLLLILTLLPWMAFAAGNEPPRPLKVGAVNIVRVFDELDEKVDMNADLRQLEEKRAGKLRDLRERCKSLEEKGKLLRPDSEEAKNNAKLLEEAIREFRSYFDANEDDIYSKLYDFTLSIYKKIRDEVEACAREAGYDIVLRTRDADVAEMDPQLRPRTRYMELNRRIESQVVLFHNPAFDFTSTIVKRLNDRHQATKAEREKQQPKAPKTEKEKPETPKPKTATPTK